ncbi:leucyl/phenylalanyl-tRNA/protein transferase [Pseudopedobacter saltans DSM 12145]|uniref:Leucyl/phenylalanyl-tRNA--protein transferase n=1 Tax=Pseudopedobacter saltans (strain ATCC 51119 / DSM 12145 / JCM 21818 / CCUG 39354 / LMG 10337 / NBRC 100064 / NCIMB 13643) TaxID=762903 RepID=F0SA19_PSESL|nr:leucyl/phenylalanyl-tRNA--protein transferase [Pseudopedobacter saltans]ADY53583.1 leucyl/phenylalanyl-tRNA/protein transferase [Pseudopedobacter saltans DSM 12145]
MIFKLEEELIFPPCHLAEEDGLLAVGGDLSPERLLLAYTNGIFPWYSDDTPILWYAPHERFVLFPEKLKISKSMKQVIRSGKFEVTIDEAFPEVIKTCAKITRKDQDGTWITNDMQKAYIKLFRLGFAHSVEVWEEGSLVGGLYGVLINKIFCGESMFSKTSNSSKLALIWLAENIDLKLIDCQVHTNHLESMGAEMISMEEYLKYLKA